MQQQIYSILLINRAVTVNIRRRIIEGIEHITKHGVQQQIYGILLGYHIISVNIAGNPCCHPANGTNVILIATYSRRCSEITANIAASVTSADVCVQDHSFLKADIASGVTGVVVAVMTCAGDQSAGFSLLAAG